MIELRTSAISAAFSQDLQGSRRVSALEWPWDRENVSAATFTIGIVNGSSEREAPAMNKWLLGVLVASACVGLPRPAAAAESCTYGAGTLIDAASPSKTGTFTCMVVVAPGKTMSKTYSALAVWGSDPFSTGSGAGVVLRVKPALASAPAQDFAATAVAAPATDPAGPPTLTDVNGTFDGSTFRVNFKYTTKSGAKATVTFTVSGFVSQIAPF